MGSVHQPDFRIAAGFVDTETFALFVVGSWVGRALPDIFGGLSPPYVRSEMGLTAKAVDEIGFEALIRFAPFVPFVVNSFRARAIPQFSRTR